MKTIKIELRLDNPTFEPFDPDSYRANCHEIEQALQTAIQWVRSWVTKGPECYQRERSAALWDSNGERCGEVIASGFKE